MKRSYKLPEIVRLLKENRLLLPNWQRPYVWNKARKHRLVDTILRKLTLGSILTIEDRLDLHFACRSVQGNILASKRSMLIRSKRGLQKPDFENQIDLVSLVHPPKFILDGQQRYTGIGEVFGGFQEAEWWLYFDLVKLASPDWHSEIDLSYMSWSRRKDETLDGGRKIAAWMILDSLATNMVVQRYFTRHADELFGAIDGDPETVDKRDDQVVEAISRVNTIFEGARAYEISVEELDVQMSLQYVREQFRRTNETPMPLADFDMAVAIYSAANYDVRYEWLCFLHESNVLRYSVNPNNRKQGLDVLTLLALTQSGEGAKKSWVTADTCLSMDPTWTAQNFPQALKAFETAYKWGRDHLGCYTHSCVPIHAPFIGLAAVLLKDPTFLESVPLQQLKAWFFSKFLRGRPPTWEEKQRCFEALDTARLAGAIAPVPVYLTEQVVLETTGQYAGGIDVKPRAIFRTLRALGASEGDVCDFWTREPIREVVERGVALENFHIYPKNLGLPENKLVELNTEVAANFLIQTKESNQRAHSHATSIWIAKCFQHHHRAKTSSVEGHFGVYPDALDVMNELLQKALLLPPEGPFQSSEEMEDYYKPQNMAVVIRNRGARLFDILKHYLGSALLSTPIAGIDQTCEEVEAEDEDEEYYDLIDESP